MEIKKVAILGAGAVGSYVIEGISGCMEIRLGVIAEGERNARLKSAGCTINGVTYHQRYGLPKKQTILIF